MTTHNIIEQYLNQCQYQCMAYNNGNLVGCVLRPRDSEVI